jgi:predicted glycoside hydrolase/deacetylase ChbG (UPF0249 family)
LKPVVVCADDFAYSSLNSRVILDLLSAGAINATSCLVETEWWPAFAPELRRIADAKPAVGVGLHLNLTDSLAERQQIGDPPARQYGLPNLLFHWPSPDPAEIFAHFQRQWIGFVHAFGREPDFVDGHRHVHIMPAARPALARLISVMRFDGWVRQCRTSSSRLSAKRLLLDHLSNGLRQSSLGRDGRYNPGFGGLRQFSPTEDVGRIWRTDVASMTAGGVLMVHPGGAANQVDGVDPISRYREQEAWELSRGWMTEMMRSLGLDMGLRPAW